MFVLTKNGLCDTFEMFPATSWKPRWNPSGFLKTVAGKREVIHMGTERNVQLVDSLARELIKEHGYDKDENVRFRSRYDWAGFYAAVRSVVDQKVCMLRPETLGRIIDTHDGRADFESEALGHNDYLFSYLGRRFLCWQSVMIIAKRMALILRETICSYCGKPPEKCAHPDRPAAPNV